MAGGSRTLKLSILGDVANLNQSLKTATTDVDSFTDKIGKAGKVIGAAFVAAAAAAGAYAVKIGIDGVKAALEDEKAQRILALSLENTTGATTKQIAAVETYITKTALATGVTDDQLRPALARLVRSTKDTEEAQKLLSLALDISSATGKPLEAIANSLGKAYDGNTNALGKLGLGIDQSILKTKDFDKVYNVLRTSFAGFSAQEANTFQGRIDRLNVAFDEVKETIGFAFLPILEKLIKFVNDNALPIIKALSDGFSLTGKDGFGKTISEVGNTIKNVVLPIFTGFQKAVGFIKDAIVASKDEFKSFWEVIKYIAPLIAKVIGGAIGVLGPIISVVITLVGKVLGVIKPVLNFAIDAINKVITGINLIKPGEDIPQIQRIGETPAVAGFSGTMPNGQAFNTGSSTTAAAAAAISMPSVPAIAAAGVAAVTKSAASAAAKSSNVVTGSFNAGSFRAGEAATMGTTVNLTVTGALDKEGTARTIIDTLNDSFFRGTGGAGNFVTT
jgi:hypothetical protein